LAWSGGGLSFQGSEGRRGRGSYMKLAEGKEGRFFGAWSGEAKFRLSL